jgi:hypothetical protein
VNDFEKWTLIWLTLTLALLVLASEAGGCHG